MRGAWCGADADQSRRFQSGSWKDRVAVGCANGRVLSGQDERWLSFVRATALCKLALTETYLRA